MNRQRLLTLAALVLASGCWLGHREYQVDGVVRVQPPGPSGAPLPAVVCMSSNSYHMIVAHPAHGRSDVSYQNAYVVCRIPADGVGIPFFESRYTTTGKGLLLAAFLASVGGPFPACDDPNTIVVEVGDESRRLAGLCDVKPPPKSELALMAPFDDKNGRPADMIRIVVIKAQ